MKKLRRKLSSQYEESEEDKMVSEQENEEIENFKHKAVPRGKRKSQPAESRKSKKSDVKEEVLEITNRSGSFHHIRPAFMQRWDGVSDKLPITEKELSELTPGLKVYWKYKAEHMNALVFVQMGRIEFHAYENDAIRLNELFGKNISKFSKYLMVHYWQKEMQLVKAQLYKMKIPMHFMMEIEDDQYRKEHKILRREVTEIINPAVNIVYQNEKLKDGERYLMAIYRGTGEKEARYGIAFINCSTNKFYVEEVTQGELRRVLNKFKPVEVVILKNNLKDQRKMIKQVSNPYICQLDCQLPPTAAALDQFLALNDCRVFDAMSSLLDNLPSGSRFQFEYIVRAISLSLEYFKKLGLEKNIFGYAVFNFISFESLTMQPVFDAQVYENLEVFEVKDKEGSIGEKGTLMAYLNKCVTPAGTRKLRKWLDSPLTNREQLLQRQGAVSDILKNFTNLDNLFQKLKTFPDFQSRIAQVFHWVADKTASWKNQWTKNKDYNQMNNPAIIKIREIRQLLQDMVRFEKLLEDFDSHRHCFKSQYLNELTTIVEPNSQNTKIKSQNFFGIEVEQQRSYNRVSKYAHYILDSIILNDRTDRIEPMEGTFLEFDKQKKVVEQIYSQLDEELDYWKKKLNCNKLKYVSAKSRNEIEMPKGTTKEKIKDLHFSSTTSKFDRYVSTMSQQLSAKLMVEEEKLDETLDPFLNTTIQQFACYRNQWTQLAQIFSQLDVLYSLACVSKDMDVKCLPEFAEDGFQYEDGIHVGLHQMYPGKITRNSVKFDGVQNVLLITGPNMGGKSTILRQTCLLAIIAQTGCYVPAKKYKGVIFDRIFCRIGANDRIIEGKSTFYMELDETKRILQLASRNSLVVIDQLGRGTSTFDGVSIAYGTLWSLVESIGCYTLFSTHYSLLADEFQLCRNVRNKTMQCFVDGNKLNFTYKLIDGVAEKSFAENAARCVGISEEILQCARIRSTMVTKESKALRDLQKVTKDFNELMIEFKFD